MKNGDRRSKFWRIVARCAKEVVTWPKWKQNIVISAETAETGQFLRK